MLPASEAGPVHADSQKHKPLGLQGLYALRVTGLASGTSSQQLAELLPGYFVAARMEPTCVGEGIGYGWYPNRLAAQAAATKVSCMCCHKQINWPGAFT